MFFKDGCANGNKCNASVTLCNHFGCDCKLFFSCDETAELVKIKEVIDNQNVEILTEFLLKIANGGKRKIAFHTEICRDICHSPHLRDICNNGQGICKVLAKFAYIDSDLVTFF